MILLALADAAASSPVDPVTAAIIAGGSLAYALLAHRKEAAATSACACSEQIRQAEERVKTCVDALETVLTARMEATHKHAGLIPKLVTDVALIKDRTPR